MKKILLPAVLALSNLALVETASAQTPIFAQWPLTANAQPTVGAGTTATPAILRRYLLSNGLANLNTSMPPVPTTAYAPFSASGQAFGIQANGGGWSSNATPVPGPGSRPKRIYYEQFAVTSAAAGRADSVIFDCSVASSANGIVAVTYSLSNYASDSASVSGGKGPTGSALPAAANGTFGVNPAGTPPAPSATAYNGAVLPQAATPAPPSTFRFALNGGTGVAIPAGRTLTIRLHFGCSSSNNGRYVLLKNVTIKERQGLATRSMVSTDLGVYPNPAQSQVVVPHAALSHDARVTVYNTVGAQVASFVAKAGTSQTTVSLEALSSGLYLVEYTNGQERSSARVVKE